jgi:hypothetical protein
MPVAAAIVTTLVLGIPIALAVDRNARGPILLGLGYLYGTGLTYLVELTLALIGIHWTALNVTAISLTISILCFILRRPPTQHSPLTTHHWIDAATVITIAMFANFATIARVWEWDFWAIWGLKARAFLEIGTIDWRFLESPWNEFAHPDYPLLLPLNYVYAALLGGGWDDRWLGLITVAFGVSFVLIVRGLAAMEARPVIASTIAFASTAFAFSHFVGLAEAPMIAFAGASLLFIRRAILFDDDAAMRHGALLLGLAAATKNEGIALLVTVTIALAVTKRRRASVTQHSALSTQHWLIPRLWPAAAIALPWVVLRIAHRFPTDIASGSFITRAVERLHVIGPIASSLVRHLAVPYLWIAMLIAILVARPRERFIFVAFVLQLLVYIAVYFGTPWDVEWQIATSWPRLTFQLATPLLVVVMLTLARTYDLAHAEARSQQP